jgi:hypothetical protein
MASKKESRENVESEIESLRHKSVSRVAISASLMGILFFIFTLVWSIGPQRISLWIISQLVLAVPLLFASGLCYAKVGFKKRNVFFDRFGWFFTTLGNNFVLNAIGLMIATYSPALAYIYFAMIFLCMTIYYAINIYYEPETLKEEIAKIIFIFLIICIGGVYPVMTQAYLV